MKEKLIISKKWHNPAFLYRITEQDIAVEVELDDVIRAIESEIKGLIVADFQAELGENVWTLDQTTFGEGFDTVSDPLKSELRGVLAQAIKSRIGNVTWTFKKATFEKQVDEAVSGVVQDELKDLLHSTLMRRVGALTWVFKPEVLKKAVHEAVEGVISRGVIKDATKNVISGIKAESAKVVGG